ncbi:hypothetical protein [Erythrobacter sp. KY5]|uniref:hypothetical protein n=1 Tax=Erythrobacter sp. KY5 TaxID=2011159 RepID=UPI0013A6A41E|nr:hypothetical protein [Erythrobacter sp. KY5]
MAFKSNPCRPDARVLALSPRRAVCMALGAGVLMLAAGCSDLADPRDYGGGAEGRIFAQCVTRTETDNPSITREQAESLCTCLDERIAQGTERPIANGTVARSETQRALLRCAADLGIEAG